MQRHSPLLLHPEASPRSSHSETTLCAKYMTQHSVDSPRGTLSPPYSRRTRSRSSPPSSDLFPYSHPNTRGSWDPYRKPNLETRWLSEDSVLPRRQDRRDPTGDGRRLRVGMPGDRSACLSGRVGRAVRVVCSCMRKDDTVLPDEPRVIKAPPGDV